MSDQNNSDDFNAAVTQLEGWRQEAMRTAQADYAQSRDALAEQVARIDAGYATQLAALRARFGVTNGVTIGNR